MSRLPRSSQSTLADTPTLRIRAAWAYYQRGLTQAQIATQLGVSRSTIIRMLEEARKRGEVQVWIDPGPGELVGLALRLEQAFGLDEAIVVPGADSREAVADNVGAALGRFLSEVVTEGMTIGVGWGRTLNASLATFRPTPRARTRVVSLLGGTIEARQLNPVDFSWQFASRLGAEAMLYLAPLVVDSAETRRRLIEECGLSALHEMARNLDLAILSCGDLASEGGALSLAFLSESDRAALRATGAVGDVGCNFLDPEGHVVDHPARGRVMNVDLDTIATARHIVIASGGAERAGAIRAAIRATGANTLVTDEDAAQALLAL